MSDTWVDETIDELPDSDNEELVKLDEKLLLAGEDSINHELIVVQNGERNGKTVLESLVEGDMDIDRVHIVKLERVIE